MGQMQRYFTIHKIFPAHNYTKIANQKNKISFPEISRRILIRIRFGGL